MAGLIRKAFTASPKAATGPGVYSMQTYAPLRELSKSPQKMMYEAQLAYRQYVWVNAAERAINNRLSRAPYHLERDDGDTIDAQSATPAEREALRLFATPNNEQGKRVRSWRGLSALTSRHMGLAGNGFWFLDQQGLLDGVPLSILYVNPVRMTAAEDDAGNLLGWIVDAPDNMVTGKPGRPGLPLKLNEVEHLILDEPDSGHFGVGIVEAAMTKIELSRLADRHAAQVLSSGGRIAGLMSPKSADTVNEEAWAATIRAWRQIVDDPDSAKRLHIVKGPVDFTPTAAKPAEMELAALATMSRGDTLAAWHVPESQIGIHGRSGLNSGDTIKFEEAAFWQGPIEDRVSEIRDTAQRILDRFGLGLRFVIDTPSFDDEQPLYENAVRAKLVPLTVNQRLELVGKDPLDETVYGDFGNAIFLDKTMVRIDPNAPEPVTPPQLAPFTGQPVEDEPGTDEPVPPKASLEDDLKRLRTRFEGTITPQLRGALAKVLDDMRADIAERVERFGPHLAGHPADSSVWWDETRWRDRLLEALQPVGDIAAEVATAQSARFRQAEAGAKADDWIERVAGYVHTRGTARITGMLRTIRDGVQKVILNGVRDNLHAAELGKQIQQAAALDEYRAELIARTELMGAYNDASLRTFSEFGAAQVQANDGDDDAECAARNGEIYTVDEASAISDHPNGTLDWSPVV